MKYDGKDAEKAGAGDSEQALNPGRGKQMKYDCLIVDDEAALSESTQKYFNMFGTKTAWVADQTSCVDFFRENQADLILLDINLGNTSGFDLCRYLRETITAPILFISARTSDDDILLALNLGGDDYIQKPYSLAVLLAKVNAVLKRYSTAGHDSQTFSSDSLAVNFTDGSVSVNGQAIELKAMEYKLLSYLIKNRNKTISKEDLFTNVWEDSVTGDNTLNVHIRHLREKIEPDPNKPRYIKTVWGTGYVFAAGDEL